MTNYTRAKAALKNVSGAKFATAASLLTITLALCAAASGLRASGVSVSSFSSVESISAVRAIDSTSANRNGESAVATQRKSGGHPPAQAAGQSPDGNAAQQAANMLHAKGTFEVKLEPQGESDKAAGSTLGQMSISKQYHGELEGTAKGTMLTVGTDVKGSAGYVAMERVTGTLNGKTGSFVLQHSGTLTRGVAVQNITVVPDSGTGQLAGITGKFLVIIADGKHSYELDYALPAAQ
jgi:hypothetical protein